jgi:filamentous hemagglutinin family protein
MVRKPGGGLSPKRAVAELVFMLSFITFASPGHAQSLVIPDETLRDESSEVINTVSSEGLPLELVEGGAQRGQNLFHSFLEFNVAEGQSLYFANPNGISNILSRVTGSNPSNIFGNLGVDGTANLFLLNPNGIIFGLNARLDLQGSFLATTADELQFENAGSFQAINSEEPSPLLVINPSSLIFNRGVSESVAPIKIRSDLVIPPGQSFVILGGDVLIDGGLVGTSGGRIELAGVANAETVNLSTDSGSMKLTFANAVNRADITLINGSIVSTNGTQGGEISVHGRNVSITDGSQIRSITFGEDTIGGDLRVSASESLEIVGESESGVSSGIATDTRGSGAGGNVELEAARLSIRDGAGVIARSTRSGSGGNLSINVTDKVDLTGTSASENTSSNLSVITEREGRSGDLIINSRQLLVRDGAAVSANVFSIGEGGTLRINASEQVEITGTSANGDFPSRLFAVTFGSGKSGGLIVDTSRLVVQEGALISAITFSAGEGGSLEITASEGIQLIGALASGSSSSRNDGGIRNQSQGSGNAGNITINTGYLEILNGAQIDTAALAFGDAGSLKVTAETIEAGGTGIGPSGLFTQSQRAAGNAGDMTIAATRIRLLDGAQISTSSFLASGNGGTLRVTATELIEIIGRSTDGQLGSTLAAQASGTGDAGNLFVDTRNLIVSDGAQISVGTFGEGNGGTLQVIAAESVEIDGFGPGPNGIVASGLFTQADGNGDAGDMLIDTKRLLLINGGTVSSGSLRRGNGGTLQINASESVEVLGGASNFLSTYGLLTNSQGSGQGGDLSINAGRLLLTDGASISSTSLGTAPAGDISLVVNEGFRASDGSVRADVTQSSGGAINIISRNIRLFGNSDVRTNVATLAISGKGENIAVAESQN